MSNKPPIIDLDGARAALDEEIAEAQRSLAYAERNHAEHKAKSEAASSRLYSLTCLRERMNPVGDA